MEDKIISITHKEYCQLLVLHKFHKKLGEGNFKFYVVEECDEKFLDEKEIEYIEKLKSHVSQHGYNITWGGEGGIKSGNRQKLCKNCYNKKEKNRKR